MRLGPVVRVPAYVAAWAIHPEVAKESLSNMDDVRCMVTPYSLRHFLWEVTTSSHAISRSIYIRVNNVRQLEEGHADRAIFESMSHRHCDAFAALKLFRGDTVPSYTRGRSCLVSHRARIERALQATNLALGELFCPCVLEIQFCIRNDVANGARGLMMHEEKWIENLMRVVVPNYSACVRRIEATARRVYSNTPAYAYTASRFLSNVERATMSRSSEAPQPAGLTLEMRPYQRKTLQFCLNREISPEDVFLWKQIPTEEDGDDAEEKVPEETGDAVPAERLWWSPVLRRFCTSASEPSAFLRGGIVAEEMGMGKTLEMLALTLSNPAPEDWQGGQTIVVCPVALVSQWSEEAKRCLENPGRIYVYHGSSRRRDVDFLKQCNVVVTTYGILTRDDTLHEVTWHRVVFDESHIARRPNTQRFRACTRLRAAHRWAVTGTPLVSGAVSELYCQLRLTKPELSISVSHLSWSSFSFMHLLSHAITRHTKRMRINGVPILDLPMMRREDVVVTMSDALSERYRQDVENAGQACRTTTMTRLMVAVDRLRRRCSSGIATEQLLADGTVAGSSFMTDEERRYVEERLQEDMCAICLEPISGVSMIKRCRHIFCSTCISEHLRRGGNNCPMCRGGFTFDSLRRMPVAEVPEQPEVPDFNAKMDYIARDICGSDSTDKFIVFSNFRLTLQRVATALRQAGVEFRDLGKKSMSISQRRRTMEEFANQPRVRVLLLPMRSTAVGLNITCANRVILMEPCLNPALEKQAIGRCWRMGQQKEVRVQRFVVANTVEQRIVEANNEMDGTVRDASGSERALLADRDRVRWGFSRISNLLRPASGLSV